MASSEVRGEKFAICFCEHLEFEAMHLFGKDFVGHDVCEQHVRSHVRQSWSSECEVLFWALYCLYVVLNPMSVFCFINPARIFEPTLRMGLIVDGLDTLHYVIC